MRSNVRLLFIYYEYLFYVYFDNEWNIMDTKKWNGILFVILMYSFIIFYRKRYIENLLEIFLQISTKNKDIRAVFRNGRIEIEPCLITNKKENPSNRNQSHEITTYLDSLVSAFRRSFRRFERGEERIHGGWNRMKIASKKPIAFHRISR